VRVANIDISGVIDGHSHGCVQQRISRRTAVAAISLLTVAGRCGDDAGQVHFADDVVIRIGQIKVAGRVEGQSSGLIEPDAVGLHAAVLGLRMGLAQPGERRPLRRILRLGACCPKRDHEPCRSKQRNIAQRARQSGDLHRSLRFHCSLCRFHSFSYPFHRTRPRSAGLQRISTATAS
jgi:hypothetical protein